jgi:hypothetical protein
MSPGWVAGGVRARGLQARCLGRDGARRLALSSSLGEALAALAPTAYGSGIAPGMRLAAAQHAVSAAALWHLRILAGWSAPLGAEPLRAVAGSFEIENITEHLGRLAGGPASPPFELGSLAVAWPAVARAENPGEVRAALASSDWGDPGGVELADVRLALELSWTRRILNQAPAASDWAISRAGIIIARVIAAGAVETLGASAHQNACRALGRGWQQARTLDEFIRSAPKVVKATLTEVETVEDLWKAEANWWARVDGDGRDLAALPPHDPSSVLGVAALITVDAWRVRAALAISERGGTNDEVVDEMV